MHRESHMWRNHVSTRLSVLGSHWRGLLLGPFPASRGNAIWFLASEKADNPRGVGAYTVASVPEPRFAADVLSVRGVITARQVVAAPNQPVGGFLSALPHYGNETV